MPSTFFEKQANGTLKQLTLVGENLGSSSGGSSGYGEGGYGEGGYGEGGGAVGGTAPLQVSQVGPPSSSTPSAPVILSTSSMPTRTSATINWSAPDNTGRPPITGYNIYRDGVLADGGTTAANVLTFTKTALPIATPERIFVWTVAAVNVDGVGVVSNALTLQWQATVAQQPTAPTTLARSNLTDTSVTLTWAETADSTVTKHGIFEGATLIKDNLSATALSYAWTGMAPGSQHVNVSVKRANSVGWSPASNTLTFTNPSAPPPTASVMLMGCSDSTNSHGGSDVWDGWRCYTPGARDNIANRAGTLRPKFLAYSEDGPNLGGATPVYNTVLNQVKADLEAFYYTAAGGQSTRWGIKLYWSNGNENFDKGAITLPHTQAKIDNYVTSQKALYDGVHTLNAGGGRRFPDAYAGSNPTHDAEQSGNVAAWLHPSARYHDFVMWSMYPPGRKFTMADPRFDKPSLLESQRTVNPGGFLIRCFYRTFQAQAAARTATGNNSFALAIGTGETGIGDDPGDTTHRPYYAAHSLAGTMQKLADQYNLDMPFACWWDNELTGGPQNILSDEPAATSPSTRVAWQTWLAKNHEFQGAHPASWPAGPKATWPTGA